jgi:hypothetical protein
MIMSIKNAQTRASGNVPKLRERRWLADALWKEQKRDSLELYNHNSRSQLYLHIHLNTARYRCGLLGFSEEAARVRVNRRIYFSRSKKTKATIKKTYPFSNIPNPNRMVSTARNSDRAAVEHLQTAHGGAMASEDVKTQTVEGIKSLSDQKWIMDVKKLE